MEPTTSWGQGVTAGVHPGKVRGTKLRNSFTFGEKTGVLGHNGFMQKKKMQTLHPAENLNC